MSLSDDLIKQPTVKEPKFTPRTEFDGSGGFIQTGPLEQAPTDHAGILELFGYDPAEVRIVGAPRISRWQTYDERWLSAYRFHLEPVRTRNLDDLLGGISKHRPHKPTGITGPGVFVFQASDLQLGKIDGDGVEGTVARYLASVDRACAELKALRKSQAIGAAHLIFAGDCIENGGVSQGGKLAWRQSLTITEQVRLWRRLLLATVKQFAPLVDELQVSVVGGNHDDATRSPVQTRADDNWATEGAIAVADAIAENPDAYAHVTVQVPPRDQGYMTVQVAETVFTVLHGHQFRKGQAAQWWSSQAFYNGNPAGAHFMCHGHWHSTNISQDGPRTIICSPTFDGGSAWFRDKTGAEARTGGLTYVTHGPGFRNLSLV